MLVTGTTFANDSATGGQGGDGQNGGSGGAGGDASGGAFFFSTDSGLGAALDIEQSNFASNSAMGGMGDTGAPAANHTAVGGQGGSGGNALGGAVAVDFASSGAGTALFNQDDLHANTARGGPGGAGGHGGGNGAAGGTAEGGGLALIVAAGAGPTQVTIEQATIAQNLARGGAGGAGARAGATNGGTGGQGASALGAGIYLSSSDPRPGDTWQVLHANVTGNHAVSGSGGPGGAGTSSGAGGRGGNSDNSDGGGIGDAFQGTLNLLKCQIVSNVIEDGRGGAGATGHVPGANGKTSQGFGGGLFIDPHATVLKVNDTDIQHNHADNGAEVWRKPGKN